MRVRRFLPFLTVLLLLACSTIDCPVENIVEVRYAVKAFDGDSITMGMMSRRSVCR